MATMWASLWYYGKRPVSTEDAGYHELTDHEGGQVETAASTAEASARAISALVAVLHDRGLLQDDEVVRILGLHSFAKVED